MAEEQKPVEVPKDTTPATEPVFEAKPVETPEVAAPAPAAATEAEASPATEAPAATVETPAAEATEAPAAEEAKKEEVVPVEEGQLEHKGLNFPKNFIYSKQFFWFGSEAVDSKALSSYRRAEKSVEAGHRNTAWASETGKGLLFFGEKSAPVGVINLADATEPSTDGPTKFLFTAGGHKHVFKAANAADRDNWVSQLKLKIAEAKELSSTVTESETYKSTLASLKPAPPAKKEEAAEAPKEEAAPAETPAVAAATETPAAAEEAAKEAAKEEPKRRSASRKRASIFGSFFGQKEESKKEEKAPEAAEPAKEEAPVAAEPAATEPVAAPVEAAAPAETTETAPAATEEQPAEAKKEEKPAPSKRNSIFGVFSKKEKKAAAEPAPAAEAAKDAEPASETAPVIPPVETSTPLGDAVADATPAPAAEAPKEEVAPATNGEKKDVKEKRKSSLPFAFGRKSPVGSDEEGEKTEKSSGPFSKLRATIKARSNKPAAEKAEEKTEEKPAEAAPAAAAEAEAGPSEAEAPKPTVEEPVNKPQSAVASAPTVTAAA